jgi:hypothetical protein
MALVSRLGGVSLAAPPSSTPGTLRLRLTTPYPTGAVGGSGDPGPCAAAEHELTLRLGRGAGGNAAAAAAAVCDATLSPPDVDAGAVVRAAREGGRCGAGDVVREVVVALGGLLHRRALMAAALAVLPGSSCSEDATALAARLGRVREGGGKGGSEGQGREVFGEEGDVSGEVAQSSTQSAHGHAHTHTHAPLLLLLSCPRSHPASPTWRPNTARPTPFALRRHREWKCSWR